MRIFCNYCMFDFQLFYCSKLHVVAFLKGASKVICRVRLRSFAGVTAIIALLFASVVDTGEELYYLTLESWRFCRLRIYRLFVTSTTDEKKTETKLAC